MRAGKGWWCSLAAVALVAGQMGAVMPVQAAEAAIGVQAVQGQTAGAEQVVQQWAQAVKTRNGQAQYALLSAELQAAVRPSMEARHWVTGTSSPWISSYQVVNGRPNPDGSWEYTVEFTWKATAMTPQIGTAKVALRDVGGEWKIVRTNWYDVAK